MGSNWRSLPIASLGLIKSKIKPSSTWHTRDLPFPPAQGHAFQRTPCHRQIRASSAVGPCAQLDTDHPVRAWRRAVASAIRLPTISADQARSEPLQQSHSVTKLAVSGRFMLTARWADFDDRQHSPRPAAARLLRGAAGRPGPPGAGRPRVTVRSAECKCNPSRASARIRAAGGRVHLHSRSQPVIVSSSHRLIVSLRASVQTRARAR